jgi:hypothetical protein
VSHDPFQVLAAVEGVKRVLFFSPAGERIFEHPEPAATDTSAGPWAALLECVRPMRESELIYSRAMIYTRSSPLGTLIVVTGTVAPSALIRLNSDILLEELSAPRPAGGVLSRLKRTAGGLGKLLQLPELYENRD